MTLAENFPIQTKFYRYDFVLEKNLVTHIAVSLAVPDRSEWPTITEVKGNPTCRVKALLLVETPHLPFIQLELRTLQGALAPFGVRSINVDEPEIEWLPENDEESRQIGFNNYSRRSKRLDPNSFEPVHFDLVARAVIAIEKLIEFETPLNFFRRGCRDIEDRQYVEAIYDFYFVLETLFSNGKFGTSAVVKEFVVAQDLCAAVDLVLSDPGPTITMSKPTIETFLRLYQPLGREKLIEKMVELRGFFHHHNPKRKGMWKPEWQQIYEIDALVFQAVAYNVVFGILRRFLWLPEVIDGFQADFRRSQAVGDLTIR